jgi:flagellin FlaB
MVTTYKLVKSKEAAMGIGSLIIFIAIMLVAGMASTVFFQTMNEMQQQALETGQETIKDIANGIKVTHISGKVTGHNITQMAIFIAPIAGSDAISLIQTHIAISNTDKEVILDYDSNYFNDSLTNGLFNTMDMSGLDSSSFGIIVIRDLDSSISAISPVINYQDLTVLMINTTACFGDGSPSSGISTRTEMSGEVFPEFGMHGLIQFITPAAFVDTIVDLQ